MLMLYNETLPPTLIKNTFTQFRIHTHLFAYLEFVTVTGSGNLARAVNYTLNGKKYYYTYLENCDLPIDNNRAEQVIRPFTVGRKNGLFSNTARGKQASAAYYSIVSTAQANSLDAETFLTEPFLTLPGLLFYLGIDLLPPQNTMGFFMSGRGGFDGYKNEALNGVGYT